MAAPVLKKSKNTFLPKVLLFGILLLPLCMFLAWWLTGKKKLQVAIINKTVMTTKGQEHLSFHWILSQEKFVKDNQESYKPDKDYYGFFPMDNHQFSLKGLERFNKGQLDRLSSDADMVYVTDTYGIYKNEWFRQEATEGPPVLMYGGMSRQDLYFLEQMRAKHKLIITEFNCIASPTTRAIRNRFEKVFGMRWTGWVGRYFQSLDTLANKELPAWLVANYRSKHDNSWPFKKSGIAFVNTDSDHVEILENQTDLQNEMPYIHALEEGRKHYGMADSTKYTFWFDIMDVNTSFNHVVSVFKIGANEKGKELLRKNNIPTSFPAITAHINKDYRFFYFSADFSNNPIGYTTAFFKGSYYFKRLMYSSRDPMERKSFFWNLYRPLVTTILNDYYFSLNRP